MSRWIFSSACAAAALALTACSSTADMAVNGKAAPAGNMATAPVSAASQADTDTDMQQLLQSYHWHLQGAQDAHGAPLAQWQALAPQHRIQLDFLRGQTPGEHVIATQVCNRLRGSYSLQGGRMQVGLMVSTRMACPGSGLEQLERAVAQQLPQMVSVQVVQAAPAPKVVLGFSDGSRWHMLGQPTDATRYGSVGETIFLEIAPHTQPCNNGNMPMQCLMVRELQYEQPGRKTITSDWQYFYSEIQGYQHVPNTRHVLRVKRYTVANPPADAGRFAYVLDMHVETESLGR